jgi:hypothetical protein
MAEDLTPAERPQPPTETNPSPAPEPVEPERPARQQAEASPVLPGRFRAAYAVLAVVVGAAVGAFMVLAGGPQESDGPAWSTALQPVGESSQQMEQIASYVSRRYRLDGSNRQLVAVTVSQPPIIQTDPPSQVTRVAVATGTTEEEIDVLSAENTAAYVLCGLGEGCAIREGRPTVERGQLLRREALELALYTFKYVDGVNSVVAFLPPSPGSENRLAVFFQKDDLEPALDRPLRLTLAERGTLTPASLSPGETGVIQRYADSRVFQYRFGQAPDGGVFLALEPPAL